MSKAVLLADTQAPPLAAQTREIMPLAGLQSGGTVSVNRLNTALDPSAAFGVTVSFDRGRGRKLDLLAIGQHTRAERNDPFVPPASAGVRVAHIQIGGRYVFDPDARTQPYIGLTIGATRIAVNGLYSVVPSGAIGGGVDLRIKQAIAVRFDARAYTSLTETSARGLVFHF